MNSNKHIIKSIKNQIGLYKSPKKKKEYNFYIDKNIDKIIKKDN